MRRVDEALRQELATLEAVLSQHGETHAAQLVRRALAGSDQELRAFLTSNELWGGAGSIADQAGIGSGLRRHVRRKVEASLIRLGTEQMRQGLVNVRTEIWVDAFSTWQRKGVTGTWLITRLIVGGILGVVVFVVFVLDESANIDGWVPIVVGAMATSASLSGLQVALKTEHYRSWSARPAGRYPSAVVYVVMQTLLGFPVVAAAAVAALITVFPSLVAG
jgi:hypothetical protein